MCMRRPYSIVHALCVITFLALATSPHLYAQRPRATTAGKTRQRTVKEVSQELLTCLDRQSIPWQFYPHHADYYRAITRNILGTINVRTPKAKVERARQVAAQWESIARAIEEMAVCQRTVTEIRNNNSSVRPEDRRETLKEAEQKHRQLLLQLAERLKMLLTRRTTTTQPNR